MPVLVIGKQLFPCRWSETPDSTPAIGIVTAGAEQPQPARCPSCSITQPLVPKGGPRPRANPLQGRCVRHRSTITKGLTEN